MFLIQVGLVHLFNNISIPYGLFNAKNQFICKGLFVIITIFLMIHSIFVMHTVLLYQVFQFNTKYS